LQPWRPPFLHSSHGCDPSWIAATWRLSLKNSSRGGHPYWIIATWRLTHGTRGHNLCWIAAVRRPPLMHDKHIGQLSCIADVEATLCIGATERQRFLHRKLGILDKLCRSCGGPLMAQ
jgi:hypothetical protein